MIKYIETKDEFVLFNKLSKAAQHIQTPDAVRYITSGAILDYKDEDAYLVSIKANDNIAIWYGAFDYTVEGIERAHIIQEAVYQYILTNYIKCPYREILDTEQVTDDIKEFVHSLELDVSKRADS